MQRSTSPGTPWRCGLGLLGALYLGGCLEPNATRCADGGLCGGAQVCAPIAGCAEPAQIEACVDLDDGDACQTGAIFDGTCADRVCVPAGCGNGLTEGVEVCDDGNRQDGDGCAATCLSDERCGNGLVDRAVGETCDDDLPTCRADCTSMRCGDGVQDALLGEACDDGDANSLAPDAACRLDCQFPSCGDLVVDPGRGETCDDGNHLAGDGCRPDCKSSGACGNGVVDGAEGEACDDGNQRGGDGCAASCQPEALSWRDDGAARPPARSHAAIGYDQARGRVVLFGGNGTGDVLLDDTWEWDGGGWHQIATATRPSMRLASRMAYDARRGRLVLFGGSGPLGNQADTWLYDGASWTLLDTTSSPPGRAGHGLVYDAGRDRIIAFGGYGATVLADTWELDGDTWLDRAPAEAPAARTQVAMAYDPIRGRSVLHGGFGDGVTYGDTWTWDGTSWTSLGAAGPGAMGAHVMTFDVAAGLPLLYTGGSTWSLVDDTWIYRAVATPYAGPYATMTYDVARAQAVVFGGQDFPTPVSFDRTYTWDGTAWAEPPAPPEPAPRLRPAMTYDPRRGVIVLFGGADLDQHFGDTWEYDGATWRERAVGGPAARIGHAMSYDEARGVVLMFGGAGGGAPTADTWAFDGTVWAPQATASVPPPRTDHGMAYDAAGARTVIFGGSDGAGALFGDTWAYDGEAWTEVATSGPAARSALAMTYDRASARVVLHGGNTSITLDPELNDDTWVLDGATWSQVAMNAGPPARWLHAMANDLALGAVVLVGGSSVTGEDLQDVWRLDGDVWMPLAPSGAPPGRIQHALADLSGRSRLVMFGGNTPTPSTWTLGYDPLVAPEACAGPVDHDDDGLAACDDDDCWSVCAPLCPPGTPAADCPPAPTCGDGVCGDVEDCRSCATDCPVGAFCQSVCGDGWCDATESAASCPGDCAA
jgi:cysteine-rich repeat protein